jgi:hypothetical protein
MVSTEMGDGDASSANRPAVSVSGGAVAEQGAVRESLLGLAQAPIVAVTIGQPPAGFMALDANWISIDAVVADTRDASEAHWYALMLAGAFRAKSAARDLTPATRY